MTAMSAVLVLSIALRAVAFGISLVLLRRLRDWRFALVSLLFALSMVREALDLATHLRTAGEWIWSLRGAASELLSLAVSLLLIPVLVLLGRFLISRQEEMSLRERAESEARGKEARLRFLMSQIPAIVWTTDRSLRFSSRAGSGLTFLGLEPSQVVGRSLFEYFQTEDPDFLPIAAHRRALDGESVAYELGWAGRVFDCHVEPLRSPRGGVAGTLGLAVDVTPRKQAEEALRASEEKYRALFETSKDAVFFSTPEGRLLDINPAGVALLGYSAKDDLLRADIARDLYHDAFERARALQLLAEQGYVKDYEIVLRRKDGSRIRVLETTTAVRDETGRISAYRGIMRDVSSQRELEAQLRQAARMEAVGRLAGGVAHDFNNVLTVINGRADLLLARLADQGELAAEVREIKDAGQRAAALTRQLLALSRHSPTWATLVNLNDVVREVEKLLRRAIREDITLDIRLAPGLRSVKADHHQLEQIAVNLALNARDAMPRGGRLVFETRNVEVGARPAGGAVGLPAGRYALLVVEDSGVGMAPEVRERIFEPFFTTKEQGRTAGLGLSTVYALVTQNGGQVRVESQPGQGTSFFVYLPAADETVETAVVAVEAMPAPAALAGHETILLVEDEPPLRRLLSQTLTVAGYRVVAAEDGPRALELAADPATIDLLLTDVVMPGLGGFDLADRLRAARPDLKIIYMSGYTEAPPPALRPCSEGSGVPRFLQKPFSMVQLTESVREALAGR